jgi:hypothetical protein
MLEVSENIFGISNQITVLKKGEKLVVTEREQG